MSMVASNGFIVSLDDENNLQPHKDEEKEEEEDKKVKATVQLIATKGKGIPLKKVTSVKSPSMDTKKIPSKAITTSTAMIVHPTYVPLPSLSSPSSSPSSPSLSHSPQGVSLVSPPTPSTTLIIPSPSSSSSSSSSLSSLTVSVTPPPVKPVTMTPKSKPNPKPKPKSRLQSKPRARTKQVSPGSLLTPFQRHWMLLLNASTYALDFDQFGQEFTDALGLSGHFGVLYADSLASVTHSLSSSTSISSSSSSSSSSSTSTSNTIPIQKNCNSKCVFCDTLCTYSPRSMRNGVVRCWECIYVIDNPAHNWHGACVQLNGRTAEVEIAMDPVLKIQTRRTNVMFPIQKIHKREIKTPGTYDDCRANLEIQFDSATKTEAKRWLQTKAVYDRLPTQTPSSSSSSPSSSSTTTTTTTTPSIGTTLYPFYMDSGSYAWIPLQVKSMRICATVCGFIHNGQYQSLSDVWVSEVSARQNSLLDSSDGGPRGDQVGDDMDSFCFYVKDVKDLRIWSPSLQFTTPVLSTNVSRLVKAYHAKPPLSPTVVSSEEKSANAGQGKKKKGKTSQKTKSKKSSLNNKKTNTSSNEKKKKIKRKHEEKEDAADGGEVAKGDKKTKEGDVGGRRKKKKQNSSVSQKGETRKKARTKTVRKKTTKEEEGKEEKKKQDRDEEEEEEKNGKQNQKEREKKKKEAIEIVDDDDDDDHKQKNKDEEKDDDEKILTTMQNMFRDLKAFEFGQENIPRFQYEDTAVSGGWAVCALQLNSQFLKLWPPTTSFVIGLYLYRAYPCAAQTPDSIVLAGNPQHYIVIQSSAQYATQRKVRLDPTWVPTLDPNTLGAPSSSLSSSSSSAILLSAPSSTSSSTSSSSTLSSLSTSFSASLSMPLPVSSSLSSSSLPPTTSLSSSPSTSSSSPTMPSSSLSSSSSSSSSTTTNVKMVRTPAPVTPTPPKSKPWSLELHGVGKWAAERLRLPRVGITNAHSQLRRVVPHLTVGTLLRSNPEMVAIDAARTKAFLTSMSYGMGPCTSSLSLTSPPPPHPPLPQTTRVPLFIDSTDPVKQAMARMVSHHFLATMRLPTQQSPSSYDYTPPVNTCIDSIEALYNPMAEMAFQRQIHQLEMAHRQRGVPWPGADTRYGYHGTKPEVVDTVAEMGLRAEFNVNGSYGYGNYIALHSSYSLGYSHADKNGVRYMFVCRVLVNGFRRTTSNDLRPGTGAVTPQTAWLCGHGGLPAYPVIVGTDDVADPHLFSVAENASSLLQFLIKFRILP